jgi:hypothetical protein
MIRLVRWISGFIALLVLVLLGYGYFTAHMAQRRAERLVSELRHTRLGDIASPELVRIFETAEQTNCGEGSPAGCRSAMVDFHNGPLGAVRIVPLAFFHVDMALDSQNRLLGYLLIAHQSDRNISITARGTRPETMKAFTVVDQSDAKDLWTYIRLRIPRPTNTSHL